MAFLKKVAKAVASGSPVAAGKSSGMFGGSIAKLLQTPGVKEAIANAPAAKMAPAAKVSAGRGSLAGTGMLGNRAAAVGNMIKRGAMGRPFQKGGTADMAGRALGKKTPDAKGRAMAKTPMKKGGMAKKSSKKC